MSDSGGTPAIVLDNGAFAIKCGYGGTKLPCCVIPTVLGRASPHTSLQKPMLPTSSRQHNDPWAPAAGSDKTLSKAPPATPAMAQFLLQREVFCGDAAVQARHALDLSYPIQHGVVTNMDDMQILWDTVFAEVLNPSHGRFIEGEAELALSAGGDLSERSLLLSEVPLFPLSSRAKLFEVMFESYQFARLQSAHQGALTVFSAGLETGVAVDCGHRQLHCTPIVDGYPLPHAGRRVDVGGHDVTLRLSRLLLQRRGTPTPYQPCQHQGRPQQGSRRGGAAGGSENAPSRAPLGGGVVRHDRFPRDLELVRRVKERCCYAAVDKELERQLAQNTSALDVCFLLPDGTPCSVGEERVEATEVLFQPSLVDVESPGLSTQVWGCIQAADIDLRSDLYSHVVLAGGSSMHPGLPKRLQADMDAFFLEKSLKGDRARLRTSRCAIRVEAPSERQHLVFLGGAALAELTMPSADMWITKAEWDEGGVGALQARFGEATL